MGALAAIVGAAPPAFAAGEPAGKASRAVQATPLMEVGTVPATNGGFLAWLEPAQADDTSRALHNKVPRRTTDVTWK